mgnify:CR=1 FL=1
MSEKSIDDVILEILKASAEPLSTYQVTKKLKVSWSTANTHLFKLKIEGKINSEEVNFIYGRVKKNVWFIV